MLSFKNFLLGESLTYKNDYVIEEEPSELRDKNSDQIDGMVQMILKYNFA